jgi:hypothetical protein
MTMITNHRDGTIPLATRCGATIVKNALPAAADRLLNIQCPDGASSDILPMLRNYADASLMGLLLLLLRPREKR